MTVGWRCQAIIGFAKSNFRKGGDALPDVVANQQVSPTFSEITFGNHSSFQRQTPLVAGRANCLAVTHHPPHRGRTNTVTTKSRCMVGRVTPCAPFRIPVGGSGAHKVACLPGPLATYRHLF